MELKYSLPYVIHPELATLVDKPPSGDEWLHEVKFDGYRLICFIEDKKVRWVTRNQIDLSEKLTFLTDEIKKLKFRSTILDGELVAMNKKGKFDFQLLQNSLSSRSRLSSRGLTAGSRSKDDWIPRSSRRMTKLIYYAFDIIYHNGKNLSNTPLLERKNLLKKLLESKIQSSIRYSDYIIGHGDLMFKQSCKLGLEGIISKNIYSFYIQKRTAAWQKVKCKKSQEFIICGFTKPKGTQKYFGSLLLGMYSKNGLLQYCGNVGTGFSDEMFNLLSKFLNKNLTRKKQFENIPKKLKDISWVKPKLIAKIEFSEWTQRHVLRHPSFKGFRVMS